MTKKYVWLVLRYLRRLWVRVIGFAVLAVATVIIAQLFSGFLPSSWTEQIGAKAVDEVLSILASSMLAVTTFSLSIAVAAFAAAASSATPRATALLQEDHTTQNVLATFLGAFLFGLVGIIALKAGYYSSTGLIVVYIATVGVIALVVAALVRWISHLISFGRVGDTLDRVENAASRSLRQRIANPWLGGRPQDGSAPNGMTPIHPTTTGYVQHLDMVSLSEIAEELDARIWVRVLPGAFVHGASTLAKIDVLTEIDEEVVERIRACFTCARSRDFDQDPAFGLIVLAEIASRALSPAVNDPGTAIDVIGRLVRVLTPLKQKPEADVKFPRIFMPTLQVDDMLRQAFRPIARDGAGLVEVQVRLQKALSALRDIDREAFAAPAIALANYALERAEKSDLSESEMEEIKAASLIRG